MSNPSIAQSFKPGDKLAGCYTLKELLPSHGLCTVWLATDEELGRDVALHFVPDAVAADSRAAADLKQEVKANRQLIHPRIVRVHDLVTEDKWAAISMDLVAGEPFSVLQEKREQGAFHPSELAPRIAELCQTLEDAHRVDLLHRNLTPHNILSTSSGLMIQMFGISRVILDSMARAGQPAPAGRDVAFISPQQLDGSRSSRADDLYGLGATLFTLLAGVPPFSDEDLVPQIRKSVPPLVSARRAERNIAGEPVPRTWDETIAACLAKPTEQRPKTAADAGARIAAGPPGAAGPAPGSEAAAPAAGPVAPAPPPAPATPPPAPAPAQAASPEPQPARGSKRPWSAGPGKSPVIAEATVLSKTSVPRNKPADSPEPSPSPEPSQTPQASAASGEPATASEPVKESMQPEPAGLPRKPGATTPSGFPLQAFVGVEGDKPKPKTRGGLIAAVLILAAIIVAALMVARNGNPPAENGGAAAASATPAPEATASPASQEAAGSTAPVAASEETAQNSQGEAPAPSPENLGAVPAPTPESTPAAAAGSPEAAILAMTADQATQILAAKTRAADQARAALAAAEQAAKDKAAAQAQAVSAVQAVQTAVQQKDAAATAAKTAADAAAAAVKEQQEAVAKAEADAAAAEKAAQEKAQAADQLRKSIQTAQAAAEQRQAAQTQAAADAAAAAKAAADRQKAADDAAKAAADAEKARIAQAQTAEQAQADLAQTQSAVQKARQIQEARRAEAAERARIATAKAAAEAARIRKLREAETAKLAAQATVAAQAAADAQKALDAARKAVADAEKAQREADQQAAQAATITVPGAAAPAGESAPAATPSGAAPAEPGASGSATLSVQAPSPGVRVDEALINSLGMRFAPVGKVLFCIWPTRVQDFSAFAEATGFQNEEWRQPGFKQAPDHPVVNVSWNDANQFCLWLTEKEHHAGILAINETYRLPTDLEWSAAVGLPPESGRTPEARDMDIPDQYPWGTQWPPPAGAGNYTGEETDSDVAIKGYNDGFAWTSPVGSFNVNKFGLYDMGGNVWEWCGDWWNSEQKAKVLRGASWYNGALKLSLLSSCRNEAAADERNDSYGFRVVIAEETAHEKSSKHHARQQ